MSRLFDISDVLSITIGRLLSNRGMKGVYDIYGYLTNDPAITTIGIVAVHESCKTAILQQHPELADINKDSLDQLLKTNDDNTEKVCNDWVNSLRSEYGNLIDIKPIKDCEPRSVIDDLHSLIELGKSGDDNDIQ